MSSAVIVNPDLFVEKLSRYGRRYREATIAHPVHRAHNARRHAFKKAAICVACMYGNHGTCGLGDCSCIHRENEARLTA